MPRASGTSASPHSKPAPSTFRGWSAEAVEFFEEIEVDNSKAFWTAHKGTYENEVLAPMTQLLSELAPEFGDGRVFRPYRDTRFSVDKSPYKTNIAAHNDAGYISLSAHALGTGCGLHMPDSKALSAFRAAVANQESGQQLIRVIADLRRKKIQVGAHEELKSAPRGYPADHPRIELLRYKGLTAWKEWPVGPWLGTTAVKKRIVDFLHASEPLRHWLALNVEI
jgi:uncharacterized protein (TIGR02453 family)